MLVFPKWTKLRVKRRIWGIWGYGQNPLGLSRFMNYKYIKFCWSLFQQSLKQSSSDPLFFIFLRVWKINLKLTTIKTKYAFFWQTYETFSHSLSYRNIFSFLKIYHIRFNKIPTLPLNRTKRTLRGIYFI